MPRKRPRRGLPREFNGTRVCGARNRARAQVRAQIRQGLRSNILKHSSAWASSCLSHRPVWATMGNRETLCGAQKNQWSNFGGGTGTAGEPALPGKPGCQASLRTHSKGLAPASVMHSLPRRRRLRWRNKDQGIALCRVRSDTRGLQRRGREWHSLQPVAPELVRLRWDGLGQAQSPSKPSPRSDMHGFRRNDGMNGATNSGASIIFH